MMDKTIFAKEEIDAATTEDRRRLDGVADLLNGAQAEFAGWREFERDPAFDAPIARAREALRAEEDRVIALCKAVRKRQHDIKEQIERSEAVIALSPDDEVRATQLAPLIEQTCRTGGYHGLSVYLVAALGEGDRAKASLYHRYISERLERDGADPSVRKDDRNHADLVAVVAKAAKWLRNREHSREWVRAMALIENASVIEQQALKRRRAAGELDHLFAPHLQLVPRFGNV
jgi:hypothetical protein